MEMVFGKGLQRGEFCEVNPDEVSKVMIFVSYDWLPHFGVKPMCGTYIRYIPQIKDIFKWLRYEKLKVRRYWKFRSMTNGFVLYKNLPSCSDERCCR